MRLLILSAAFLSLAAAQESRHEVVQSTGAADAKPNDPKVPEVVSIPTQFERVVILRFKYQTELLSGLERAVKDNHIQNGVILSAFGSVRNYQVHQVSNRTLPSKNMFVKDATAPADILGMSGYVLNGRLHPHIALANPEKAFGGHLEPGTNVFTFAVVTIGVLPDNLDLSRLDDKNFR
ncbi:MAG TPA: PPC domain-containing DNA-binding protein [Candidatus Sulfopaludibacter sp.]|nr:PPC domain-containing DNA-binding protein [Candidatus Sulfopaludibacter sp.]